MASKLESRAGMLHVTSPNGDPHGGDWTFPDDIIISTGGTERVRFANNGEWDLAGLPGSAGQYLRSSGAGAPPTWGSLALSELPTQAPGTLLGVRGDVSATTPTPQVVQEPLFVGAGGVGINIGNDDGLIIDADQTNMRYRKSASRCEWSDDFLLGIGASVSTSGTIYQSSDGIWVAQAAGATASISGLAGTSLHPGKIRLTTGATSGNGVALVKAGTVTTVATIASDLDYMCFTAAAVSVTSTTYFLGFSDNLLTTSHTSGSSVFFYVANGAVHAFVNNGASSTDSGSLATVTAGSFHTYEIMRDASGNFQFYLDGVLKTTISTNIPTSGGGAVGCSAFTSSAAAISLDLDYAAFQSKAMGR